MFLEKKALKDSLDDVQETLEEQEIKRFSYSDFVRDDDKGIIKEAVQKAFHYAALSWDEEGKALLADEIPANWLWDRTVSPEARKLNGIISDDLSPHFWELPRETRKLAIKELTKEACLESIDWMRAEVDAWRNASDEEILRWSGFSSDPSSSDPSVKAGAPNPDNIRKGVTEEFEDFETRLYEASSGSRKWDGLIRNSQWRKPGPPTSVWFGLFCVVGYIALFPLLFLASDSFPSGWDKLPGLFMIASVPISPFLVNALANFYIAEDGRRRRFWSELNNWIIECLPGKALSRLAKTDFLGGLFFSPSDEFRRAARYPVGAYSLIYEMSVARRRYEWEDEEIFCVDGLGSYSEWSDSNRLSGMTKRRESLRAKLKEVEKSVNNQVFVSEPSGDGADGDYEVVECAAEHQETYSVDAR